MITVDQISKAFGETKALDRVSMEVPEGQVFGLLGPNGAGKTTLVRVLATLLKPDSGRATIAGIDVTKHPMAIRSMIGLAGQFAAVEMLLTGRENLEMVGRLYRLSAKEARKRAAETLERLGLVEAGDRLVKTYSGGMRRRLDLGASLVGRPSVLILDEPTTGLDPRTRLDLWSFLEDLVRDGATILLTTQYLEEADRLAKKIMVIDHGKVIAEGTSDELKDRLGGDVIELNFSPDTDLSVPESLLGAVASGRIEIDHEENKLTVPVNDGSASLLQSVRLLDEKAVAITGVSLRRPTLDDVFLALTGKATDKENLEDMPGRKTGKRGKKGAQ